MVLRTTEEDKKGELGESFAVVGCDCDDTLPSSPNSVLPRLLELGADPMSTANQNAEFQTGKKKTEKNDDHNKRSLHPELRIGLSDIAHDCNNWAPSSIRLGTTLHRNPKISTCVESRQQTTTHVWHRITYLSSVRLGLGLRLGLWLWLRLRIGLGLGLRLHSVLAYNIILTAAWGGMYHPDVTLQRGLELEVVEL